MTPPTPGQTTTRRVRAEPATRDEPEAPNGEPFHVRIRASTTGLARDGGVIPLEAWTDGGLEAFRKNPVVMLAHGRGFPLGVSVFDELNEGDRALVSFWRFHEESEESRLARRLYEGGYMRAASVGFRIHEWHDPDEDELDELRDQENIPDSAKIRWVADSAELLEESAVGVPSDPGALADLRHGLQAARARGIDVGPLADRLEKLRRRCRAGDARACRRLEDRRGRDGGGERTAVVEFGEELLEVPLEPGETAQDLMDRVIERADGRLEERARFRGWGDRVS